MKKYLYITIPVIIIVASVFLSVRDRTSYSSWFSFLKSGRQESASAAAPRTGLVGWWTMDSNDINGTTYYDKSGNKKNMTSNGTPTQYAGKINQGTNFNALGDWLKYTGSLGISGSTSLTLSAWVKPTTLSATGASIFGMMGGTSDTGVSAAIFTTNGNVSFSTGSCSEITANNTLVVGKWQHIVITKTPGLVSTTTNIYIDGVSWSHSNQYSDCTPSFSIAKVMIGDGWWNADSTYPFDGSIDDVRIYNRALSAQEVAQLYSSAKTSYAQSPQRASSTPVSGGKLVGWWTMDANDMSATGATMYDKSGFGNNGTVTGTTTSTGKIGQARSFNGTSDYVNVADVVSLRFTETTPFTIGVWFKTSGGGAASRILSKRNANDRYLFVVNANNTITIQLSDGASTLAVTSLNALNDSKWHFGTYNYNGANDLKLYIDGVLQGTDSSLTLSGVDTSGATLTIGNELLGNYFSGSIDDVRVYNYALSAQEVVNLYNASKQSYVGATVRRTGLVLDLNFGNNDGQSAPKVFDTSSFNRHATSTAGTTSPTCGGKFCDFDGGDYMTTNATGVFNSSNISIAAKFTPDFAANDGVSHRLFDTTEGARTVGQKWLDGNLYFYLGATTLVGTISLANYQSYWKVGKENIIIVTGTSGNNKIWLNGNKLTNNQGDAIPWTAQNPTALWVGSSNVFDGFFDGKFHYFKVWNRLLTDAEVGIISADRAGYVR